MRKVVQGVETSKTTKQRVDRRPGRVGASARCHMSIIPAQCTPTVYLMYACMYIKRIGGGARVHISLN